MSDREMTVTLSVSRKVNLGNYESADVFMSINNVPVGATAADIEAALVTGKLTFDLLKVSVTEKARDLRQARETATAAPPPPPPPAVAPSRAG